MGIVTFAAQLAARLAASTPAVILAFLRELSRLAGRQFTNVPAAIGWVGGSRERLMVVLSAASIAYPLVDLITDGDLLNLDDQVREQVQSLRSSSAGPMKPNAQTEKDLKLREMCQFFRTKGLGDAGKLRMMLEELMTTPMDELGRAYVLGWTK